MITISCTQLEQVRRNPVAYAQLLASNDALGRSGQYGMFAYFKDAAKTVHTKVRTVSEAIMDLQNKYIRFAETPANKAKQEKLIGQLATYTRAFTNYGFELVDGHRNMKWNIVANAKLTGRTPWVVENEAGQLFSYLIIEKTIDWKSELRFPLYQKYLSENTMKCDLSEIQMGVFDLSTGEFDFVAFSPRIVNGVIAETTNIFENVNTEFLKIKK